MIQRLRQHTEVSSNEQTADQLSRLRSQVDRSGEDNTEVLPVLPSTPETHSELEELRDEVGTHPDEKLADTTPGSVDTSFPKSPLGVTVSGLVHQIVEAEEENARKEALPKQDDPKEEKLSKKFLNAAQKILSFLSLGLFSRKTKIDEIQNPNNINITIADTILDRASQQEKEQTIIALEKVEETTQLRHVRIQLARIRTQIRQSLHPEKSPEQMFDLKVGQLVAFSGAKEKGNFFMRPIYTAIEKLERAPVHVAMVSEVSPTTKIIHMSDSSVHEETLSEALKKTQGPYNIMSMKTGSYDGGKAVDYMREQIKRKPGFDHINGILANANTIGISQSVVDSLKGWLRFDFFHKASDYVTCCEVVDNAIEFAKYGEVDEDDFIPNASYFANELGVDTNMILPDGTYWA